jgi:hypothetical protein
MRLLTGVATRTFWLLTLTILSLASAGACRSSAKSPPPSAETSASASVSVGSFDDRYDFRSFAERLSNAIETADVQFFMDNVSFQPESCSAMGIPAPPESCKDQPVGATVPGIVLARWQSEGQILDTSGYEKFVRDFLANPSNESPDKFGDAKARLYAFAVFNSEYHDAAQVVQAISTRIVAGPPPGRLVLFFHVAYDAERWSIVGLGLPAGAQTAFLDPLSQEGIEQGAQTIFQFWSRWGQ